MDLSFPSFDRAAELVVWPGDLAVLMIGVAARQAGSPTACAQGGLGRAPLAASGFRAAGADARLFAPLDGAFNGGVAADLLRWRGELACPPEE